MTGPTAFFGVFDGAELRGTQPVDAGPDARRVVLEGRVLRVAADVGGSKPIFYASEASTGALVFGESATQVLIAAGRDARVNAGVLRKFLASGRLAGDSQTLFEAVRAIPRGGWLEARDTSLTVSTAREPDEPTVPDGRSLEDSADELRALLMQAVANMSRDGRIAVALSGGIDSSGLLACAAKQCSDRPVEAFCYACDPGDVPKAWNELPWAESAARACSARLHRVSIGASEVPAYVARVVAMQDFPFASPVILAQAKLFATIAEAGHDAVLGGHGPEILFGGRIAQAALRTAELLRQGNVIAACRLAGGAASHLSAARRDLLRAAIGQLLPFRLAAAAQGDPVPWASSRWFEERVPPEPRAGTSARDGSALIDDLLSTSLGATSLLLEDCNAATNALDNRQPYLANAIVRFARRLPLAYSLSPDGQTKHVLRLALNGLVPQSILDRRERVGFAVPVLPWLLKQRPWVETRYGELRSLPFFAGPPFAQAWAALEAGEPRGWATAYRIWRWLVLLEWTHAHEARFE
jgi:asparagine synthase (glutamine-hydrolysing)